MQNGKVRKWDEIRGMPLQGHEKRMNVDEVTEGFPGLCKTPVKTVEEMSEQDTSDRASLMEYLSHKGNTSVKSRLLAYAKRSRNRQLYFTFNGHTGVWEAEREFM